MTRAFALVSLLEALLILAVVVSPTLRKHVFANIRDPRVALVVLFWFWVLIACLWGSAPLGDRLEEWWSWRKLILVPIGFAVFQSKETKLIFMFVVVFTGAVYMLLSWLGYFGLVELDRDPSQVLENHATQGVFFSASALMATLLAVRSNSMLLRVVLIASCIGFIANILFILTGRSGYLSLLSGAMVCGLLFPPKLRMAMIVCLGFLAGGLLIVFETPSQRIKQAISEIQLVSRSDTGYSSLGIRTVMWENTLKMISHKPILGTGSGSYKNDYGAIVRGDDTWRGIVSDNPHQQYLHIWAEQGLIGLLIFLVLLWVWFRSAFQPVNIFVIAGLGVFLGCVVNSFANGHFSSFVEGRLLWISIAVLFSPMGRVTGAKYLTPASN